MRGGLMPLDNTLIIPQPTRPSLVLRSPSAEPYHRQDQAPAHLIIYWKFLFQCIGPTIRQRSVAIPHINEAPGTNSIAVTQGR